MFPLFSKKGRIERFPFGSDVHSHLLPGIDDGVKSLDEAKSVILVMQRLGFSKLVTTPHVMRDVYRNTTDIINEALAGLRTFLEKQSVSMSVEAAAEYYLDESVMSDLATNTPLLTFGKRYLLFETNSLSEPFFLKDFIFKATSQGYKPVLAHPERYLYMTPEKMEDLRDRGVLFQINSLSLTGFYSKQVQKVAERFIDRKCIDFLGSDCHCLPQAVALEKVWASRAFKKAIDLPLLNFSL